ncbi:hypothetical protein V2J09_014314 [Rumex salicifolius]
MAPIPPLSELASDIKQKYVHYEDAFFKTAKGEVLKAKEHPAIVAGVAVTAAFILMRGPRRFLIRNTLGRFQSEETKFLKAEKNVNGLKLSVDLTKRESKKLLERSALAEKEMQQGHTELLKARDQLHRLTKSFQRAEAQSSDLMEDLREIPLWEAIRLRAEVASTASLLKQEKNSLNKRMTKLSDMGIPTGQLGQARQAGQWRKPGQGNFGRIGRSGAATSVGIEEEEEEAISCCSLRLIRAPLVMIAKQQKTKGRRSTLAMVECLIF